MFHEPYLSIFLPISHPAPSLASSSTFIPSLLNTEVWGISVEVINVTKLVFSRNGFRSQTSELPNKAINHYVFTKSVTASFRGIDCSGGTGVVSVNGNTVKSWKVTLAIREENINTTDSAFTSPGSWLETQNCRSVGLISPPHGFQFSALGEGLFSAPEMFPYIPSLREELYGWIVLLHHHAHPSSRSWNFTSISDKLLHWDSSSTHGRNNSCKYSLCTFQGKSRGWNPGIQKSRQKDLCPTGL